MWKKTGVVALRDAELQEIPEEVWREGGAASSADFTNNCITRLPSEFSCMVSLKTLNLSRNALTKDGLQSGGFKGLFQLQKLSLQKNR